MLPSYFLCFSFNLRMFVCYLQDKRTYLRPKAIVTAAGVVVIVLIIISIKITNYFFWNNIHQCFLARNLG